MPEKPGRGPPAAQGSHSHSRAARKGSGKSRKASFSRRRMRLRTTALPSFFVTVKPKRGASAGRTGPASDGLQAEAAGVSTPVLCAALRNSARFFSRAGGSRRRPFHAAGRSWSASRREARRTAAGMASNVSSSLRPTGACGRARGGRRSLCGRRRSPCGRESRADACAPACSVDRSASRFHSVANNHTVPRPAPGAGPCRTVWDATRREDAAYKDDCRKVRRLFRARCMRQTQSRAPYRGKRREKSI